MWHKNDHMKVLTILCQIHIFFKFTHFCCCYNCDRTSSRCNCLKNPRPSLRYQFIHRGNDFQSHRFNTGCTALFRGFALLKFWLHMFQTSIKFSFTFIDSCSNFSEGNYFDKMHQVVFTPLSYWQNPGPLDPKIERQLYFPLFGKHRRLKSGTEIEFSLACIVLDVRQFWSYSTKIGLNFDLQSFFIVAILIETFEDETF